MNPTNLSSLYIVLTALSLIGGAIGWVYKAVMTIRTNDLAHIDAKIDEVHAVVDRLESKLDAHIEWHLAQR